MNKFKYIITILLFLTIASPFAFAEESNGDENNITTEEDNSEENNPLQIGGNFEIYQAADISNGNLYRSFIKLDLDFKKTIGDTEFVATLRAQNDNLKSKGVYFESKDNYNSAYALDTSHKANAIIEKAALNGLLKDRNSNTATFYIHEAYINHDFFFDSGIEGINLKVGKIIYTWGNSDQVKPVDIINPQDLSFSFFKPIQERKIGVISGNLGISITEDIVLEGVVIPKFTSSVTESSNFVDKDVTALQTLGAQTTLFAGTVPAIEPENKAKNFTYASRLGFSIFEIDMHGNYYYGYDKLPTIVMDSRPVASAGKTIITPEYKKIQMFGFDFQKAINWGISIRGEVAYYERGKYYIIEDQTAFITSMMAGNNGTLEKDLLEYTVGFDDSDLFGINDLYTNIQFHQKRIINYDETLKTDETVNWIVAKIEYKFLRQKAAVETSLLYDISDNSYAVNPEASYKVSDSYKLILGGWIMDGKSDNTFCQYDKSDFVYASGEFIF